MALNVFELFGKIVVDNSGAEKGIDKTVKHAKDAESSLAKTFKKVGTMVAAAFSVRAVVDFGKQCTQAYASIAAEESAFAQIMGDYADTAQAKLNAVSDQTGVVSTRMTGAMTSLTAKFKGLGYDVEDATTLAADGLLIASDAAAFWDMSLDESMSHLNSFINGSYEGGEAIGLFANDTQMAAYAIEQGIVKDTKAWAKLDEAQRQATRLDYAKKMMADSGATGQAAKEADAYANVMANLKEHWRQFQGIIGKPILEKLVLPAMKKLNEFMPKLTEGVQNGIEWLDEGFGKIKGYFEEVFTEDGINMDALPDALTNMFRNLGRSVGSLLNSFGRTLKNGWGNTVWPMTQKFFKATFGIDVPEWSKIESIVTDWWDGGNGIAAAIASVCIWTLNLFGAPGEVTQDDVSNVLSTWWTKTKTFVQTACDWTLSLFKQPLPVTLAKAKTTLSTWWASAKVAVQKACDWTLGLFNPPKDGEGEDSAAGIITKWWNGIKEEIEKVCKIDLSKVNVSEIFTSAQGAYNSFIGTCEGFVNDVLKAVSSNENGEIVLGARLSGLFDAGVKAAQNILTIASTLVADVVAAITGDEEGAKKIGNVFKDLFGVGSEVVIGVKDNALALFDWFKDNGETVAPIIRRVAVAMALFALAKPATFAIGALATLIGIMTVDWKHFKDNYPHLVQMFEDLTGLDFTKVSSSLSGFQSDLEGIIEWFKTNDEYLNYMLTLVGAVAFATGHHVMGTALVGAGVGGLWAEAKAMVDAIEAYEKGEGDSPYDENGTARVGPVTFVDPDIADEIMRAEDFSDYTPVNRFIRNLMGIFDGTSEWFNGENTLDEWKPMENSFTLPNSDGTGGNNGLQGILSAFATQVEAAAKAGSAAGVAEGLSGVTLTANVYAGDVNIDGKKTGSMVAPWVNLELGVLGGLRG